MDNKKFVKIVDLFMHEGVYWSNFAIFTQVPVAAEWAIPRRVRWRGDARDRDAVRIPAGDGEPVDSGEFPDAADGGGGIGDADAGVAEGDGPGDGAYCSRV